MKSHVSIALKILIAILMIIAIIVVATIYNPTNRRSAPESTVEITATPTPEPTPTPTTEPTPESTPTPVPAHIPAPNELMEFNLADLTLENGTLEYTISFYSLNASWDIIEQADYNVLYALDENDVVYYKDILWPDIDSWPISNIRRGSIVLLSYEDMGEEGAQDDVLIKTQYQKVVSEDALLSDGQPLQNKYYIIVDKEDFTIGVFTYDENGLYTKQVAAFPCAVGRSSRMTALGTFEISSKGAWKRWNSSQYSPYYTKFTSGIYIHGPIYRSKRFDALLPKSYNAIGTKATSGCLRTTVEAAMFIYYECPAGTIIEVVKSSDLVDHVEKIPILEEYPRWDPTDPENPGNILDTPKTEE
jgi:hypothetical protein